MKSEEEMRALFPGLNEACDNTELIAEKCRFDFEFGHYHLPRFKLPKGETDSASISGSSALRVLSAATVRAARTRKSSCLRAGQ